MSDIWKDNMKVKFAYGESGGKIDTIAHNNRIEVQIGETTYILSQTIDGKLNVNKSDGDDGNICVHPRYANVVEIS